MSMKNSTDTIGNRTRDLVAQFLNQMRHRVPPRMNIRVAICRPGYFGAGNVVAFSPRSNKPTLFTVRKLSNLIALIYNGKL
jgi:hypothetical protein